MTSRFLPFDPQKQAPRWELPLLICVAIVAGLGRFWNLGAWSIELDEALFLSDARLSDNLRYPVGYRFAAWVWDLFGVESPDEWLLRLPSALAGIAAIPATYWAARSLLARRPAALASAIVAVSSWALFWSQMARFYALTQLICLLAGGFFLRGLQRGSIGLVLIGAGLIGLAPFAHPSGGLFAGGLWISAAVWFLSSDLEDERRRWMRRIFFGASLVGLVFGVLWALDILAVWRGNTEGVSSSPLHLIFSAGYFVTPWVGVAFLIGLTSLGKYRSPEHAALIALVVGAGLLSVGASFIDRFAAQYVFFLLPWIAMVAAFGIQQLWFPQTATLAVLALSLGDTVHYQTKRFGDRPRWKDAALYVAEHSEPGDLYIGMHAPALEYYFNPGSANLRVPRSLSYLDRHRHDLLQRWSLDQRRIWLIINEEEYEDWGVQQREDTQAMIQAGCELQAHFSVQYPLDVRDLDVAVWLWQR